MAKMEIEMNGQISLGKNGKYSAKVSWDCGGCAAVHSCGTDFIFDSQEAALAAIDRQCKKIVASMGGTNIEIADNRIESAASQLH